MVGCYLSEFARWFDSCHPVAARCDNMSKFHLKKRKKLAAEKTAHGPVRWFSTRERTGGRRTRQPHMLSLCLSCR